MMNERVIRKSIHPSISNKVIRNKKAIIFVRDIVDKHSDIKDAMAEVAERLSKVSNVSEIEFVI